MRLLRPLLLLAFLVVVALVGFTYYARLKQQAAGAPAKPAPLPPGTTATSHGWTYTHTSNEKTVITVHADDFQEIEGKQHLAGVVIDINRKDGKEYNRVKSAKAEFDMSQGILYSDGEVEITMGVPQGQEPSGRLMVIKSSGVRVESKTGKASTDPLATLQRMLAVTVFAALLSKVTTMSISPRPASEIGRGPTFTWSSPWY